MSIKSLSKSDIKENSSSKKTNFPEHKKRQKDLLFVCNVIAPQRDMLASRVGHGFARNYVLCLAILEIQVLLKVGEKSLI